MPQVFQVLKCYKCSVFQVHQVKKSNKYACKVCGEKQSIKRHYGVGTGKECRLHVQKLNSIIGELSDVSNDDTLESGEENSTIPNDEIKQESKWTRYVKEEKGNVTDSSQDKMFLDDTEVVLELPKRKRLRKIQVNQFKNANLNSFGQTEKVSLNNNIDCIDYSTTTRNHYSESNVSNHSGSINLKDDNTHTTKRNTTSVNNRALPSEDIISENKMNTFTSTKSNFESEERTLWQMQRNCNKISLETINKNSKWAKFAEGDNKLDPKAASHSVKNLQDLFTLCDNDEEIENILDI